MSKKDQDPDPYAKPRPLRFNTMKDLRKHVRANKLKITTHETHSRGQRVHVVDGNGKPRTLTTRERP